MRYDDVGTILRGRPGTGPYAGEESGELDWSDPIRVPDVRCSIQPATSNEINRDRETVVAGWVGLFPPGTAITSIDRFFWRGRTFTVDGEVALWTRRGRAHHLTVPFKRVS